MVTPMPEPNTDARIRAVEQSIRAMESYLVQLVELQKNLKDLSAHTIELLTTNRFTGERLGHVIKNAEIQDQMINDLKVQMAKFDMQFIGVWRLIGIANAIALAVFGWYLSKG